VKAIEAWQTDEGGQNFLFGPTKQLFAAPGELAAPDHDIHAAPPGKELRR
jgi:hypothetical protein